MAANVDVEAPEPPAARRFGGLVRLRDFGVVIAVVVLFIALSVSSSSFLTDTNLLNIADQWAPTAIMACGGTVVLIVGGFDLSIAGIFVIGAVVSAKLGAEGVPIPLSMLGGVFAGMLMGVMNGFLTTKGRINPFVTTITTGIIMAGLAQIITQGFLLSVPDESFLSIGSNAFLGLNLSVWIAIGFGLFLAFLLNWTAFGRYVYATGGNREAARLSGVRTQLVTGSTYAISGLAGGIAGLIVASRTGTATAQMGVSTSYNVFAAMLLGGNSILGGEGAIWRTVVGVTLIALISNGFNLLNIDPLYQQVATGGIILAAVALDAWSRRVPAT